MKLLTRTHINQRRLVEILRVIEGADKPIGARAISDSLSNRGYDLGERAVRYNLGILDDLGFTKKRGFSGRTLTLLGKRELGDALVDDRIGFVNTRIEEFMLKTDLNPTEMKGNAIANISILDKNDFERVLSVLIEVFNAGYSISRRVLILDEGEGISTVDVPLGFMGIATLCSITLDGILMKQGIPAITSFAGVAAVRDGMISNFTDLIAYAGSSLDPMKIFMARRITSVAEATRRGSGKVLANVREIPVSSVTQAKDLLKRAAEVGIGGRVMIGEPGCPVLGCPIGSGKIGIVFCAGVNGPIAAEELGARIETAPISLMIEYSRTSELK